MHRLAPIFLVVGPLAATLADSPAADLVPAPLELTREVGEFVIERPIITADSELAPVAAWLLKTLHDAGVQTDPANAPVRTAPDDEPAGIMLEIAADVGLEAEGYRLTVTPQRVRIAAETAAGLTRGAATLAQLVHRDGLGRHVVPAVRVRDFPRYRHRGMLLDCGRHFMEKEFIKRYIDLLAYHKMNVLHWHLTEDQGWRIEIRKYPKLTEIGAWRKAREDEKPTRDDLYGGFYTQDDIREIVAYAKSRWVTVIPEIEMPGHCLAALASYPELSCNGTPLAVGREWGVMEDVYCAGNERVFEFLQDVLSEVLELFPSEYIHIGGDECLKKRWQQCLKCQFRLRSEGLKDEHELQSYFIRRIEKFLNSRGRRIIGWDEILEGGLAPNATVQSWRGLEGAIAAARSGHDVICSPTSHCYLDYPQEPNPTAPDWMGLIDLKKAYAFEPTPPQLTPEQSRRVLGLEGNIWTERAPPQRVDHQVFPRLCALAEVGWSPEPTRNWKDFQRRMRRHYQRLDALGVMYCVPAPHVRAQGQAVAKDGTVAAESEITLENPFHTGEIRFTLDGSEPGPESRRYAGGFRLDGPTRVRAATFLANGNRSDPVDVTLVPR